MKLADILYGAVDENYVIYSELDGEGNSGYICSVSIQWEIWENFCKRETTQFLFSATLLQLHIIKTAFHGKEDYAIYAESPLM